MHQGLSDVDYQQVETVLRYWFGGDQQTNYKTKWFPDGSSGLQSAADQDVQARFGCLFEDALSGKLNHWQQCVKGCIALIVVLDQFSRHICRLKGKDISKTEQTLADTLALDIAKRFHERENVLNLPMSEYVFSLMPLRHTATVDHLSYVLKCLEGKELVEAKSMELLGRFRKQTIRRLQHLQDREKLEATADILEREAFKADEADIMSHPLVRTTEAFLAKHLGLSPTGAVVGAGTNSSAKGGAGSGRGNKEKGDKGRADKAGSSAADQAATDAAAEGMRGLSVAPAADTLEPFVTLLISLSGGVDSMVISKILRLLQLNRPYLRIKSVLAMHIDYGNRPESAAEAQYVQRWCTGSVASNNSSNGDGVSAGDSAAVEDSDGATDVTMLGGVRCLVRRVDEVTRGVTDREEYEKVSRDIRYSFYKTCMQLALQAGSEGGDVAASGSAPPALLSGVIFGHHLGDVQENVISNVMRGSGPLQLSGMTEMSVTNGVAVWRPLLSHNKDAIYDFAHRYGVPYFKDSTPSWSTRGKLRNQLVPLLLDMYGSGCLHNLTALAMESDLTRALVQDNLYQPFLSAVRRHPCGLSVNVLPHRHQPQCFWREALKQLMHSMNMGMIRDKAVGNFVERLQRTGPAPGPGTGGGLGLVSSSAGTATAGVLAGWLELRKGVHTFLTAAGDLVVLRDHVLRQSMGSVTSNTTLNQRRQQMLSQARKQPNLAATVSAVQVSECALEKAAKELLAIRLDVRTGELRCDSDKVAALSSAEFGIGAVHGREGGVTGGALQIGPWQVQLVMHTATSESMNEAGPRNCSDLKTIEAVLPGSFSYDIPLSLPVDDTISHVELRLQFQLDAIRSAREEHQLQCELLRHLTISTEGTGATAALPLQSAGLQCEQVQQQEQATVICPADLHLMEARLRHGLPLLVLAAPPRGSADDAAGKEGCAHVGHTLRLQYCFMG